MPSGYEKTPVSPQTQNSLPPKGDTIAVSDPTMPDSFQSSRWPSFWLSAKRPDPVSRPSRRAAFSRVTSRRCVSPGLGTKAHTVLAKPVLGHTVAVAGDVEPRFPAHAFGQVEGDEARVVRDKTRLVGGAQFNQRHGSAAAFFDDLDPARRGRRSRSRRSQPDKRKAGGETNKSRHGVYGLTDRDIDW